MTTETQSSIVAGSEQDLKVNVGDTVHFDYNAFAVKEDDKTTLQRQAAWLQKYPAVRVTVEGHCDTKPSESLARQAVGADLLLHEALNRKYVAMIDKYSYLSQSPSISNIMEVIPTYHSTPEDAAKIAQKAHVAKLVLYHIIPPIPSSIFDGAFLGDAQKYYDGPITVGVDGRRYPCRPIAR